MASPDDRFKDCVYCSGTGITIGRCWGCDGTGKVCYMCWKPKYECEADECFGKGLNCTACGMSLLRCKCDL